MNEKVIPPFGRVAKRIVIEADDKGLIRVSAVDIPLIAPGIAKHGMAVAMTQMDSREMVLALMKVMIDYTSALFGNMTLQKEGPGNGEQKRTNPNSSEQQ